MILYRVLLVLLVAGCSTVSAGAIAKPGPMLRLHEPAGQTLRSWPVSTGVPLPPGWLRDPNAVQLRSLEAGASGTALPVQARTLGRWPDGSVRWLALDWQTNLAPRQESRFALEPAAVSTKRPATAGPHVEVRDAPTRVEIDTGSVQFAVPKQGPGFLADVRQAGRPVASGTVTGFMDIGGERHTARPAESVVVTEAGPLRARIEVRGAYTAAFGYVVRIDAYAGHPFVRVLHTFEQHGPEPFTPVRQLALEVGPLPADRAASYRAGREGGEPWSGRIAATGIVVAQDDNETARAGGARQAGHAAGWIDVHGPAGGLAVVARYFWQEYPQSFVAKPGVLTYNLWAPDAPPAMVGMGAAKTHELVLLPHGAEVPAEPEMEALRAPLAAAVDPDWVVASGALRNTVAPRGGGDFLGRLGEAYTRTVAWANSERWDDGNAVLCTEPARERPRRGFFGMLNWGDWNFPGYHDSVKGCDAWGNLEYDTTQVLALAYAATGEARYHDAMVAAARHFMDVDRIHYQNQHPAWVGMNHPKNPLHFSFERGGVDLGHTWNEGLLSYYALTGDDRALAAARDIADYLVARMRKGNVRGNPRQWGWPQVALVAAYEATGDASYRDAALAYARGGMAAHPPAPIAQWKLGILADGLSYTHAVTGDAAIRTWLTQYAAAWQAQPALADPRLLPGIAYVARLTGDATLRRQVGERLGAMNFGGWAKPWTIGGRTAFRVRSLLAAPAADHSQASRAQGGTTVTAGATAAAGPASAGGSAPTPSAWDATPSAAWP